MRRWIAWTLVWSVLVATSGIAAEAVPAAPKPGQGGPLALQITGAVVAVLGGLLAADASTDDGMGAEEFETLGLIGVGVGVALFAGGTIWRYERARSAGQPATSLDLNLFGPGLLARASF